VAFADDLLADAKQLARRGGRNPKQSTLRRSVSTAYYALFHLLIADFVANWKLEHQRARLGRMFEHRKMSQAAFNIVTKNKPTAAESDMTKVIDVFAQLQEDRYSADYDVAKVWSRTDVMTTLVLADEAFKSWRNIRKEKLAQDHLLTMFGARRV
jgi:uncharacterized protein (UPF0332 family)